MTSRYIRHSKQPPTDIDAAAEDIKSALTAAVSQCVEQKQYSSGTVYMGLAGCAQMKYYLSSLPLSHLQTSAYPWTAHDLRPSGDRDLHTILQSTPTHTWRVHDAAHISYLETNAGIAALALCRSLASSQELLAHWERCVQLLQRGLEHVRAAAQSEEDDGGEGEDEDGCEVLYGRAGFLYALLRVRESAIRTRARGGPEPALPPQHLLESAEALVADESIRAVVGDIVRRGEVGARRYAASGGSGTGGVVAPPLMWAWHGKRYLGAAHGVAGILQVLWGCPPVVIDPYIPRMLGTVRWLVGCQDPSGNWPTKARTPPALSREGEADNELVQWCHGAPGITILLSTVLRWAREHPQHMHAPDAALHATLTASLRAGARLVYRHGLLRKGLGLCHGVAGSVFALLAAADVLDADTDTGHSGGERRGQGQGQGQRQGQRWGQGQYARWAVHLAHLATAHVGLVERGEMGVPERPLSLYEGVAGMCCVWALVLARLGGGGAGGADGMLRGGMPGYDDLQWDGV